jgi:hypothetical protein
LELLEQVLNWDFLSAYQLLRKELVNRIKHPKIDVTAHLITNYVLCRPLLQKNFYFFSTVESGQREY